MSIGNSENSEYLSGLVHMNRERKLEIRDRIVNILYEILYIVCIICLLLNASVVIKYISALVSFIIGRSYLSGQAVCVANLGIVIAVLIDLVIVLMIGCKSEDVHKGRIKFIIIAFLLRFAYSIFCVKLNISGLKLFAPNLLWIILLLYCSKKDIYINGDF